MSNTQYFRKKIESRRKMTKGQSSKEADRYYDKMSKQLGNAGPGGRGTIRRTTE